MSCCDLHETGWQTTRGIASYVPSLLGERYARGKLALPGPLADRHLESSMLLWLPLEVLDLDNSS